MRSDEEQQRGEAAAFGALLLPRVVAGVKFAKRGDRPQPRFVGKVGRNE